MRGEIDALVLCAYGEKRENQNWEQVMVAIASAQQTGTHCACTHDERSHPDKQERFPLAADLEILSECDVQGLEISP
jgi:predicted metal-dependent enzyme (double-stranded beta helix superfamily)